MQTETLGPSPGRSRNPTHAIVIRPADGTWSASLDDILLARSSHALLVEEAGYDPVVYFPPADVEPGRLAPSPTRTHCPFKGDAHYYAIAGGSGGDVAWFYPRVYDEVGPIAGHVAFYTDRVELRQER